MERKLPRNLIITVRTAYGDLWQKGDRPRKRWERQKDAGWGRRQGSGCGGNSLLGDLKDNEVEFCTLCILCIKVLNSWPQLSRKAKPCSLYPFSETEVLL